MSKVVIYSIGTTIGTKYGYMLQGGIVTPAGCAKWKTIKGAERAALRNGHEIVAYVSDTFMKEV